MLCCLSGPLFAYCLPSPFSIYIPSIIIIFNNAENTTQEEVQTDSVYSTGASAPQTTNVSLTIAPDVPAPTADILSATTTPEMSPLSVAIDIPTTFASKFPPDASINTSSSLQLADNASPSQIQVPSLTTTMVSDITAETLQEIGICSR